MKHKINLASIGVLVLLSLALVVGACGPGGVTPPPTEKAIKIMHLVDLTGPYSTITVPISSGASDYWKRVNQEEGGIAGIKIEELKSDTKGTGSVTLSLYRRFKEAGAIAGHVNTSTENVAIQTAYNNDKIPFVGSSCSYAAIAPDGKAGFYYIAHTETMGRCLAAGADWYYKNEWPKKGLARRMRVAILTWDNPLGHDGADGVKRWIERTPGVELSIEAFASPTALDYTIQLTTIKGSDPDLIVFSLSGGAYGMAARDAAKVGLSEDIPLIIEPSGLTKANAALAGEAASRWWTPCHYQTWWGANPEAERVVDYNHKYRAGQYLGFDYLFGWDYAQILHEGMRRAVETVGYENLTGLDIKKALDTVQNFAVDACSVASFGEYVGDRAAHNLGRMVRWDVAKGEPYVVGDWFEYPTIQWLGYEIGLQPGLDQ